MNETKNEKRTCCLIILKTHNIWLFNMTKWRKYKLGAGVKKVNYLTSILPSHVKLGHSLSEEIKDEDQNRLSYVVSYSNTKRFGKGELEHCHWLQVNKL